MPSGPVWLVTCRRAVAAAGGGAAPASSVKPACRVSVRGETLAGWMWGSTVTCWRSVTRATRWRWVCSSASRCSPAPCCSRSTSSRRSAAATARPASSPRPPPSPSRSPVRGAAGCSTGWGCAAPWRPSLLIQAVCWSIAPWVDYAPLMALAALAGLFVVPTFSILRQVIIRSVPGAPAAHRPLPRLGRHRAVLHGWSRARRVARDGWDTGWALFTVEMAAVLAGCVLWVANPAIKGAPDGRSGPTARPVAPARGGARAHPGRLARLHHRAGRRRLPRRRLRDPRAERHRRRHRGRPAVLRRDRRRSAGSSRSGARARSSAASSTARGTGPSRSSGCSAVSPPRRRRSPSPSGVPSFAVLITLSGVLCAPTHHGDRRAAEPGRSRALPRRDDGLARLRHDRRARRSVHPWQGSPSTSAAGGGASSSSRRSACALPAARRC